MGDTNDLQKQITKLKERLFGKETPGTDGTDESDNFFGIIQELEIQQSRIEKQLERKIEKLRDALLAWITKKMKNIRYYRGIEDDKLLKQLEGKKTTQNQHKILKTTCGVCHKHMRNRPPTAFPDSRRVSYCGNQECSEYRDWGKKLTIKDLLDRKPKPLKQQRNEEIVKLIKQNIPSNKEDDKLAIDLPPNKEVNNLMEIIAYSNDEIDELKDLNDKLLKSVFLTIEALAKHMKQEKHKLINIALNNIADLSHDSPERGEKYYKEWKARRESK